MTKLRYGIPRGHQRDHVYVSLYLHTYYTIKNPPSQGVNPTFLEFLRENFSASLAQTKAPPDPPYPPSIIRVFPLRLIRRIILKTRVHNSGTVSIPFTYFANGNIFSLTLHFKVTPRAHDAHMHPRSCRYPRVKACESFSFSLSCPGSCRATQTCMTYAWLNPRLIPQRLDVNAQPGSTSACICYRLSIIFRRLPVLPDHVFYRLSIIFYRYSI